MHCKPIAVALLTLLFTTYHVHGHFNALGSWGSDVAPNYLIVPNNEITSDFVGFINASCREQTELPEHNPGLLVYQVADLNVLESTKLFLTLAFEGTDWLNSLDLCT
jgi:hypothetical protein